MNKVILTGNITKDVELKTSENGLNFCRFTIAVPRQFKDENGERNADFINLVAWRNLAETISKFVKKGDKVGVIAKIQTKTFQEDGKTKFTTNIIVDEIEFLNSKKDIDNKELRPATNEEIDGIPF